MDEDYDEAQADDDFFEQDGPGLFGDEAPADDPAPVVTQEPDDGLEDDPEDEILVGGADALGLDPEPTAAAAGLDAESLDEDGDGGEALAESVDVPEDVVDDSQGAASQPAIAAPDGQVAAAAQASAESRDAERAPLALYRRYRPETFAEVIGQEHVTDPLQRALTNNKVNHAYLFSGPRGCGKTTSARILARCLNCEQGPTPTPCGVCQSCRDLARGGNGSIDVIEIDAASHGGVEDARDLRERAFFAPVHSRYKIYIIDEAHMVTAQGFNALLKLVEEPPPHVKFIFATTEPEKVIGTIRSRTHHYPFRLVPPKVLQNYLATLCQAEGVAVDQAVLPLVVRAGAGSVRDSLSVLDQLLGGAAADGVSTEQASALLGYTPDALLDEIVDAFAAGDSAGVFATIDKVIEVGQDPRRFAEDLLRRLRDLVIVAAVPDAVSSGLIDVAGDQAERLETQANGLGAGELTRAAEVIATGLTDMRGTTAPRLYLELMCARVLLPGADVDERGIHARLDRLERRIGMSGAAPLPVDPNAGRWSDDDLGGQQPGSAAAARAAAQAATGTAPGPQQGARATEDPSRPLHTQPQHFDDAPAAPPQQQRQHVQAASGGQQAAPDVPQGAVQQGGQQQGGSQQGGLGAQQPGVQPATQSQPGVQGAGQAGEGQRPAGGQAGQRPAQGQRPAGQRPAQGQRPSGGQPGQGFGAPEPSQQPTPDRQAAARAAGNSIGVADVRRLWPQVLEEVKARRRFAWILLSQNAQVVDVSDGTLVLGFTNAGARDRFGAGGSQDVLRDCMVEVMGADLRVEAIIDGSAGAHGRGGHGAPAGGGGGAGTQPPQARDQQHSSGPQQGRGGPAGTAPQRQGDGGFPQAAQGAPAAAMTGDGDPGPRTPASAPEPPDPEEPASAGPPPAADSHRWTEEARRNIRATAAGPAAPEVVVDDAELVSDDDENLDESGESAHELITRALGGQVIAEEGA